VPISAIAVMCGVARITLYEVLWTGRASEDLRAVLTPLVHAHEAGKLKFKRLRRSGGGSRDRRVVDVSELNWSADTTGFLRRTLGLRNAAISAKVVCRHGRAVIN
jgi:hypothetical protein